MRILAMLLVVATPTWACNADFIAVEEWSIKERRGQPSTGAEVSIKYRLTGDRPYRLIDGSFIFTDAMDWEMERIAIPREKPMSLGAIGEQKGIYPSSTLMMAAKMNPSDVIVTTCTRSVIYDDGTRETFAD